MLSIFEEIAADRRAAASLCLDAVVSLARQWLLRSGLWKILAAIALAGLPFAAIPFGAPHMRSWTTASGSDQQAPVEDLVKITLTTFDLISVILAATVSWSRAVSNRRRASCHWSYVQSRSATAGFRPSKT
jgi:hypothetical protein